MEHLIEQMRTTVPLDGAETRICVGPWQGCSLKLLGFLESELDDREARIGAVNAQGWRNCLT